MKERMRNLLKQYDEFITEHRRRPKGDITLKKQVKDLLDNVRAAGKESFDLDERKELSDLASKLKIYYYEHLGDVPDVRLELPAPEKGFVNRVEEIRFMTEPYCPPYLLLSAPQGYGKTFLLKKVQEELKGLRWHCIFCKFLKEQSYSLQELTRVILLQLGEQEEDSGLENLTPQDCGIRLSTGISETTTSQTSNYSGFVLILDGIDAVDKEVIKDFFEQCLPIIKESLRLKNKAVRFRIIVAGRYISSLASSIQHITLASKPLPLFDFYAVYEMVEMFDVENRYENQYKQDLAAYLMTLNGGHPGCLVKILKETFGHPIPLLILKEENTYSTIVAPIIKEIKEHAFQELQEIFETLSPVRRFNPRMLRYFINKKSIRWSKSEYDLETALLQTYIVSKEAGFLKDDITRRLLAIHLCRTKPKHFKEICEQAVEFYTSQLENPAVYRPDILALELLFQKLQLLHCEQNLNKEQFFKELDNTLHLLTDGRQEAGKDIVNGLIDLLEHDWEFQFTLNYYLREESYNDEYPFREFILKIINHGR